MSFETSTERPLDENEIYFEANSNNAESGMSMSPDDFVDHETSPEPKLPENPILEGTTELAPAPTLEITHSSEPPAELITEFGTGEWENSYACRNAFRLDLVTGKECDKDGNPIAENAEATPEETAARMQFNENLIANLDVSQYSVKHVERADGTEIHVNIFRLKSDGWVTCEAWKRFEKKPVELAPPQAVESDDEGGADDGIVMVKVETISARAPTPPESLTKKESVGFFVEPKILGAVTERPVETTKIETPVAPAVTFVGQTENVSLRKAEITIADTTESSNTFGGAEFVPTPTSLPAQEIKTAPVEITTFAPVVALPKMTTEKSAITIIEAPVTLEVSEPMAIKEKPEMIVAKTAHKVVATTPLEVPIEKNISNPQIIEIKTEPEKSESPAEKIAIAIETVQTHEQNPVAEQREKTFVAEPVLPVAVAETAIDNIAHSRTEDSAIVTPKTYEAPKNEASPFTVPENSGITLEFIDEQPENETATIETNFQPNIMWSPEKNAMAVPEEIRPAEKSGIEIEMIDEPVKITENTVEPVHIVTETLKDKGLRELTTKIITPEITGIVLDEKIEPKVETVATPPALITPEIVVTTELNSEYKIAETVAPADATKIHEPIAATAPEKSSAVMSEKIIPDLEKPKAIVRPIAAEAPAPRPNIWRAPRPQAESAAVRKNKSAAPAAETFVATTNAAPNFIGQERPRAVARVLNVLRPVELVRALTRRRPTQIPDPIEDSRPPTRSPLTRYAANS